MNRIMTIGMLALSLVLIGSATAKAQNLAFCCWGNSDIHGDAIIKGLGNVSVTLPAYEVTLVLQQLKERCLPPSGAQAKTETGIPHGSEAVVETSGSIPPEEITKNGRFTTGLVFTDAELREAIGGSLCKDNWISDDIVATALQAFGYVFECKDGGNPDDPRETGCTIVARIGQQLCAPAGNIFQEFDYSFVDICGDKKTLPGCPDSPALDASWSCPAL